MANEGDLIRHLLLRYRVVRAFIAVQYGCAHDLRRLPARNLGHNPPSTMRRQTGILMDVHPALLRIRWGFDTLSFSRKEPDGQPVESSQQARVFRTYTAVQIPEASSPRLIIAVLNNRDLNMVSWELRALGGAPKVAATQDLPDIDYAATAELLGLKGLTVARPEEVGRVWDAALSEDRPVVIDVKADPNVIVLPPHACQLRANQEPVSGTSARR